MPKKLHGFLYKEYAVKILFMVFNEVNKGTYFRAFGFAKEMALRGHEVTLIATSPKNKMRTIEKEIKKNLLLVEMPDLLSGPFRSGWDIWNTLNRIYWLRNKKFDVIHSFESRPTVLFPSLFLKKKKMPLIMDWADWFGKGGSVEERPNLLLRTILRPVETYFEKNFRKKAIASTVICSTLKQKLISLGVKKGSILQIPNGVDQRNDLPREISEARREIGLSDFTPIIGWVGAAFKNDAKLMADAFNHLTDISSDFHLMVVGYFNHDIRKMVKRPENIISTGLVDQNILELYLSSVDIFWLPIKNTNANRGRFPYKLTQYMLYRKPIIASSVGDIPDIFKKADIGELIEDKPEKFALATYQLYFDIESKTLKGINAKKLVEKEYLWSEITNRLEEFYFKII